MTLFRVFSPPAPRDLPEEDCLGCTLVQLAVCFGGGAYFASLMPFKDASGKINLTKHPLWFQRSVRGGGVALVALGMFRIGEVLQMVYRARNESS